MTIKHVEVPTELLSPSGKKRKEPVVELSPGSKPQEMAQEVETPKKKAKNIKPPYHAELKVFFEQLLKDAGHPGLNRICKNVGLTQEQILPTLSNRDC